MAGPQEIKKPTIHLFRHPSCDPVLLREIKLGMEEEGIPWAEETRDDGAVALAWDAARSANLEVGIGLDPQFMVLHYNKLKPDAPLFQIPTHSGATMARALGSNAARLVKKLPLKALDGR